MQHTVHHHRIVVAEDEADFFERVGRYRAGGEQRVHAVLEVEQVVNAGIGVQRNPLRTVAGGLDTDLFNVHIHLLVVARAVGEADIEGDGAFVVVFFSSNESKETEGNCD